MKNLVGLYLKENGETGVSEIIEDNRSINGVGTQILQFKIPDLSGFWAFNEPEKPQKRDVGDKVGYVACVVCEDIKVDYYRTELRLIIDKQLQNAVSITYGEYTQALNRLQKFTQVGQNLVKQNAKVTVLTDEGEIEIVSEVELRHDQYFAQSTLAGCTLRGKMGDFKKLSDKLFFVISTTETDPKQVEKLLRDYAADQLRILAEQFSDSANLTLGRANAIQHGVK